MSAWKSICNAISRDFLRVPIRAVSHQLSAVSLSLLEDAVRDEDDTQRMAKEVQFLRSRKSDFRFFLLVLVLVLLLLTAES